MTKPRPQKVRPWTRDDHEENARRIQRDADQKIWTKLGRLVGIRGREFAAAFGRLLDDRIAIAIRTHKLSLIDQLKAPDDAEALRGALSDLISDDVAEMFQILSGYETDDHSRDKEETPGSGSEDATYEQRDFYEGEAQETET